MAESAKMSGSVARRIGREMTTGISEVSNGTDRRLSQNVADAANLSNEKVGRLGAAAIKSAH
jgi:hypothetical protein